MDLGAYANIEALDELVKKNGIYCPRLRGYRLMKDEEKVDINEVTKGIDKQCLHNFCTSMPIWSTNPKWYESSDYTDYVCKYYGGDIFDKDSVVRWDRIHGKKRRILKTAIHNKKKEILRQYEMWNKYVGRPDILYIHARLGGANWEYYHSQVDKQPWFLEKVDDSFDSTYCDIYAKIKVGNENEIN